MQKVNAIEKRSFDSIPDLSYNPLSLVLRHQRQTEYVKNLAPAVKNAHLIINSEVKDIINQRFGTSVLSSLTKSLDNMKYNNYVNDTAIDEFINYFLGNWAKSVTNTPSVLLKQITSFIPYSEGIDKFAYSKNFVYALAHPFKTKKFMNEISPYVNVRFNKNEYRALLDKLRDENSKNPVIEWFKEFNNKIALTSHTLTEIGDIFSVIYGGYARYQTNIDNGMTHNDALKDFEGVTVRTQQSDLKSLQSVRIMNDGLLNRLSGMFQSQNYSYLQKNLQAITEAMNGDINKAQFYQKMIMYNFAIPLMLNIVISATGELYGKRERSWFGWRMDYLTMASLGFTGVGLLGQVAVVDLFDFGRHKFKDSSVSLDSFKDMVFNIMGTLTGAPVGTYNRLLFDRKYGADLYDSGEEVKKKRKRIKKNEKELGKS